MDIERILAWFDLAYRGPDNSRSNRGETGDEN